MKNFQPGGLRNRRDDIGGRPRSDADKYAPKKRFDGNRDGGAPRFGGGDRAPRFNDRDKADVKLYSAICTTCGKSCEVPFRPDGSKPVLCKECFANKNASPTNMSNSRERFTPNEQRGHKPERTFNDKPRTEGTTSVSKAEYELVIKQLGAVEVKINQILELIKASEKLVEALPVVSTKKAKKAEVVVEEVKKERKPKKVTPAIKKAAVKKKVAVAKKVAKKVAAKKAAK